MLCRKEHRLSCDNKDPQRVKMRWRKTVEKMMLLCGHTRANSSKFWVSMKIKQEGGNEV